MGEAARRVRLLGRFEVEGIETSALGSRKGRLLLKRLALDPGAPVSVDTLVATLWAEDETPARPPEQVSVLVSRLRRVLGHDAITFADGAYTLSVDWIDVEELRSRVDEAARRLADGSAALSRAASSAALALVRGRLLAEDIDEWWTEAARASVDRLVARARHVAAEGALAGGLGVEAAEHAALALAEDPYDEAALRLLMRAHVIAGRPALALAAFAETSALIAEDLGVDLDPQTRALHVAILRGEAAPTGSPEPATADALIGRADELETLESALRRALAGSGVLVTVEGEAGIGKSRLLAAFAHRTAGRAQVLRASAEAAGVLPLGPILDVLARRLASAPEEERAAILGGEVELLDPLLRPGAAGDASAYRDLLVAYEPGEQSAPAVLHLALLAVFGRLAALQPVALLVDDIHLADAATVSWLGLIARHGSGLRMLAVAAGRPGLIPTTAVSESIVLDRLDPADAAAVVAAYVDPDRLDAVVERSAGLPLFLVELAQATGDTLPDSIRESVVARIADAGPAAETLRAAAVLGGEVDVDLLASVLDQPTRDLLDHLEEGGRRRILDDASSGYVFHHDLIREALEVATPSARRAWLHRQAAHVLARRTAVDHLSIAHHARLGGDSALAASALCAAAEQAGARFDHDAALALAEESLGLTASADAHLIRARSLVLVRRYDEAREEAAHAHVLGAGANALEVAAFAAYYARDLDAVLRLADEAAAISEDPEVLDTCQYLAAKVLHTRGHLVDADRRLAPMAAEPGRSRIASFGRTWRALLHLHQGEVEATVHDLAGSASARLAPVPFAPLYVEQFVTHLAGLEGRALEALHSAERLRQAVAEQNALRFTGRAEVYRGWALAMLCDPSAQDALDEARDVARAVGNLEPLGQGGLSLAALHLDHGDVDAATTALEGVDEVLAAGGQVSNGWRIELRARYLRGQIALLQGDAAAAREAASAVVARARADNMTRYDVLGTLLGLEAAAATGEQVLDRVVALLPRLLVTARPEAWRLTARLATTLDAEGLRTWSRERVEELARLSGPHADDVRTQAALVLSPGR